MLAKNQRNIAEYEAEAGGNFKIVETGGLSMKSILQKSNPMKTVGREHPDCLPCKQGMGEGVIVKTVVLIMKWIASCVHKTGKVYILEN